MRINRTLLDLHDTRKMLYGKNPTINEYNNGFHRLDWIWVKRWVFSKPVIGIIVEKMYNVYDGDTFFVITQNGSFRVREKQMCLAVPSDIQIQYNKQQ